MKNEIELRTSPEVGKMKTRNLELLEVSAIEGDPAIIECVGTKARLACEYPPMV
jgi:hypothetical protein